MKGAAIWEGTSFLPPAVHPLVSLLSIPNSWQRRMWLTEPQPLKAEYRRGVGVEGRDSRQIKDKRLTPCSWSLARPARPT